MRYVQDAPQLAALVARYVRPDRRYVLLRNARFLRLPEGERTVFVRSLAAAARQATTDELTVLLEGDWRPRLTGAVLAGMAGHTALRERIGALLLDSELVLAGQGYCFALASFGTPEDAAVLIQYLDRYLPQTHLRYDQPWALGALLHIDENLHTDFAARFMLHNGAWRSWAEAMGGTPVDPHHHRRLIEQMCTLLQHRARS